MELIDCGISGSDSVAEFPWSELDLAPNWQRIVRLLSGSEFARSIQKKAVVDCSILQSRRNLIAASTTNSGKTLVGLLTLLRGVAAGGRVLLIEPLRALAEEKGIQLREVEGELSDLLGIKLQVVVSTGDYRCHDEMLTDPPPASGQFIIATPERVESIIRNPDNAEWLRSINTVVLDEAHLLTVSKRGMLIENVITTFKMLPNPPRISLLSATLQNVEQFVTWLNPCDVIEEPKACELLGSLGMSVDDKQARQVGYKAVANSIIIYERGLGRSITDLSRRWKCADLAAIEEKWRDQLIWLLGAYAGVLDRRVFYYHLEATLKASQQRIDRVSQILKQMQFQVYALQDHIKYCSPLGGILRSLKRTAKGKGGIGIQSIRKLEAAGVTDLAMLATMNADDLKSYGLRQNAADAMISYVRRRSQ